MKTLLLVVGCWICIAELPGALAADDPATGAAAPPAERALVAVSQGPFEIDVALEGVFEAKEKEEIVLQPETWAELIVREAAPQGAAVKAGDVILRLDTRKLEEAIKDLESAQKVSDLAQRQLEADLGLQEKTSPLDLASAQRAKQAADEDLKHFLENDREMQTRSAQFNLKQGQEQLDYVTEELKQLEKMYRGDDLREETEEIILTRQRNQVEAARFSLELTQAAHERTLKVKLPREEEKLHDAAERANIALEKLQLSTPSGIAKARLDLEKARTENARSAEKLEKLRRDLAMMKVQAPRTGVVYYGACKQGQWTGAALVAAKLQPSGALSAHEVLMTIVNPDSLEVRATVPESQLHLLKTGLTGGVTPTAFPGERIAATIAELPKYPDVSGKFSARLTLDAAQLAKLAHPPAPGMTCAVKVVAYKKADALTIPIKALFTDDGPESKEYVIVKYTDAAPQRLDVQTGQRTAEQIEIISGLRGNDKILLERPAGM